MLLDIRKFFAGKENDVDTELLLRLENESFPGCRVTKPVKANIKISFNNGFMMLSVDATAEIEAECARCLSPLKTSITLSKSLSLKEEELLCDEPELPVTQDLKLDIEDFIYTELVLEVPTVLLCRENCEGLCQVCGAKISEGCSCLQKRAVDDRLSILETLLS